MSTKGIYTALSGAMAQNQKMDTIANNLANVGTTGFKKDQQVFQEYLTPTQFLELLQTLKVFMILQVVTSLSSIRLGLSQIFHKDPSSQLVAH